MISKKKFGTTVTAFGVAAGMLLGSAAPAHAEETAKTVQETQKEHNVINLKAEDIYSEMD